MADDNIQADGGQVDDGAVDGGQVDDKPAQTDSEFMEDTVDFIKKTQDNLHTNDDADDTGSDDSAKATDDGKRSDLSGTDIPDAFSDAAEASGMSAADIVKMANKYSDEELLEMIPSLTVSLEDKDDKQDDKDDKQDKDDDDDGDNKDAELEARIAERIQKQLEEKFGTSLADIEKFKAYQEERSMKETVDKASKLLDDAAKEFPVFGKTEKLPRFPSGRLAGQLIPTSPEMKARLEVLRYADSFIGSGADIDDAMAKALATYKGMHLEKESHRKVIRDLKNHEVKLSGARTGRETKKKYADSRDEIIDEIRQMQRAAGIE